ncbi:MAG: PEP-CTERM sorting domain-containing protein [Planctomycetes bacterium]|nr:PEP-CTERM sorting domain-containing protein [Planctomycetota bacterium]
MASSTASAGDLGIVRNGDVELESRFAPHGTPGVDHPNGYPDSWHHSANAAWSGVVGGPMSVSPTHSLYLPDTNSSVDGDEEHRSFATPLPAVGNSSRVLDLSWKWKWDKVAGDLFSATVRISKSPVVSLDLAGPITDHVFLTDGSALSGGGTGDFEMFMASIPLAPDDRSFDMIFVTGDEVGDRLELGTMWVDDISGTVPEPATMGLLGLAGLGLMMVSRRRRG